ncbi:MAG: hypothetical protein AAGE59_02130 [Cyanobacteria bacterium P01_F01_bin.86]
MVTVPPVTSLASPPDSLYTESSPPETAPLPEAPLPGGSDDPAENASASASEVQLSLPVEEPPPEPPAISRATLKLAAQDVRMVIGEQNDQSQILTTKLNILFVANGALLTSLSISRLIITGGLFSLAEVVGFLVSFSLLMGAFLPRQVAVTPNLEDQKFLEKYLLLSSNDYQLQMLVNLSETYKANKQRLEDISQSLKYAAYTIWGTAAIMLIHILAIYLVADPTGLM